MKVDYRQQQTAGYALFQLPTKSHTVSQQQRAQVNLKDSETRSAIIGKTQQISSIVHHSRIDKLNNQIQMVNFKDDASDNNPPRSDQVTIQNLLTQAPVKARGQLPRSSLKWDQSSKRKNKTIINDLAGPSVIGNPQLIINKLPNEGE